MDKKPDKLDIEILKLLRKDASLPYKQIAATLNTSTTTVCDRVKRLKKDGYIFKVVALLDSKKFDQDFMAYVHLSLTGYSEGIIEELKRDLSQINEVCECYGITGYYSIRLKIITTNSNNFSKIETAIAGLKNVKAVESYIVLKNIIEDTGFDLSEF